VFKGLLQKSKAADEIQDMAGQAGEEIFIPVAQGVSDDGFVNRLGKAFYKEALPIIPGVQGRVGRQAEEAAEQMREWAVREALPEGGKLPLRPGENVLEAAASLKAQIDEGYGETVKKYAFNIPNDLRSQISHLVRGSGGKWTQVNKETTNKIADEMEALIAKMSDNGTSIDGTNLLSVKKELSDLLTQAKGYEKKGYEAAIKWIDDHIASELSAGNSASNLADLARYKALGPAHKALLPLSTAAEKAAEQEGRFRFRDLARAARKSPEQRAIGQLGAATVDKPVMRGGLPGKIIAGAGMAGAGFGAFMSLPMTAAAIAAGHGLSSKVVQRAMMGDTGAQRVVKKFLEDNPELARQIGSAVRTGITSEAVN
jgi:hypothetical protein